MDVLMPQLGETVSEGKVATWFKSVGDTVKAGENLFEIETDKVTMEIQATDGGTLFEIRVQVGEVVKVGAVVAIIGSSRAAASPTPAAPSPKPADAPAAPSLAPLKTASVTVPAAAASGPIVLDPYYEVRTPAKNFGSATAPGGTVVTPLARRLAAEAGIDLAEIKGSGPRGRIVAADIRAQSSARPSSGSVAAGPSAAEIMALYRNTPFDEIAVDAMRMTIASRLQMAKQTVPHFYIGDDIAVDALIKLHEDINAAAPRGENGEPTYRISLNDFLIKAWAVALQAVPTANAVWAADRILRFSVSDVAVAVALDGGLITPVLRNAESKSVKAIATEMRDLAARARARKLLPDEYKGGSSAISNLGMYGVREFSAIINPPHGTILAVGATRRQAVETEDGSVAFAGTMTVTLSCDHRVVDGALGAELLAAFKSVVASPLSILL